MDIQSIVGGLLLGIIAVLGVGYLVKSRSSNKYQDEAEKAETVVKVQEKREEDDADPIDKAISDFDHELDADNKPKRSE